MLDRGTAALGCCAAGAWALLLMTGCGDDDASHVPDSGERTDAEASAPDGGDGGDAGVSCEHRHELTGGFACAVAPSATGEGIVDDFGYHAVGVPDGVSPATPLLVYLKGTLAMPFDANAQEYPGSSLNILEEAVSHGHLALIVAYDRLPAVATSCGDDLACFGPLRREIIEGVEAGDPGDTRHVRPPNDVLSRIDALLDHLNAQMPGMLPATVDWSTTTVGGHSQGAGHAVYIAKELRAVHRVCAFAGPQDGDASGQVADWIASATMTTAFAAMRGLVHQDDDAADAVVAAFETLGLQQDVHFRVVTGATDDPHNFVVQDAALSADRVWACYE